MIDRDQLREALAAWDEWSRLWCEDYEKVANREPPDFSLLVEAARLVVEGREVEYCNQHLSEASMWPTECHLARRAVTKHPCRMVRMILIDGSESADV